MPRQEESPSKVKVQQVQQDIDHAGQKRATADAVLNSAYDMLCDILHVHEHAHPDDDEQATDADVREMTQRVLDATEHYNAMASEELEFARAACTLAFRELSALKEANRDLAAQDDVLQEALHEYDQYNAHTTDELYQKKLHKLHDLQHQVAATTDAIEQLNAKLAAVQADHVELTRKHSVAVQKAERELLHMQQQCDAARKDVRTAEDASALLDEAHQQVTGAMKALSACASKLKLPTAQGNALLQVRDGLRHVASIPSLLVDGKVPIKAKTKGTKTIAKKRAAGKR
ncbi:Aste57867_19042 [Aphanomyces stellatus]|uniref:Aste57867_19042 protein n=1 Tax=Aphanomyces stellatus TaxID=120398 RepID=A0A485LBX6_9STRA|nr:hypothetical protein As57867_018978 [Aphanomyces stellatus]VFT95767.1 Aste57867_19042 [Aphanomyces stellatus]